MAEALKVERTIFISAPTEKVWEALITPELSDKWFFPVALVGIGAGVGEDFIYAVDGKPVMEGTIAEYEPGKRLVHSWSFPSCPDDPPSRVTYQIDDLGEMSRLTMTHDGFASKTDTYLEVLKGWDKVLASFKSVVEEAARLQGAE